MKNNQQLKRQVFVAVLAAIAYLLMFISFPVLPYVPFLKLDFADIPILIGLFMLGPSAAVETTVLKLFLYWMTMGFSVIELIGLSSSLVVSLVFITIFWLGKKYVLKSGYRSILVVITVALLLTVIMSILNYLVFMPLYINVVGFHLGIPLAKLILIGIAPFNLLKGLIVGTVFTVIINVLPGRYVK